MRILMLGVAAVSLCLGAAGCKKSTSDKTQSTGESAKATDTQKPAAPAAVGMADPFARLGSEPLKALKAGYAALKAKKYDDARDSFHKVSEAVPDYTSARYMEARAAALGGHFADVPALWGELLARDYVAFAGKLDKPKDLAALRAAPEWAQVKALETTTAPRYAADLDKGFFFVARLKDAAAPTFKDGVARLDLKQEAFHYDPTTQRYRRLTETGGHVFAINLAPDRKLLQFLVLTQAQQADDKEILLSGALGGYVDLKSLETVGPFKIPAQSVNVSLYFNAKGEPIWQPGDAYTVDSAKTALVQVTREERDADATFASFGSVDHGAKKVAGVKLGADAQSLEIDGVDKPVRAARPLSPTTLEWSPDKKWLAYAGSFDACKVMMLGKEGNKNELFLWDNQKKLASRIAQAVSSFDSLWLDNDHLVYEGGVGKEGKLHVYEVSTRSDSVLKARYGGGLFGYPTLSCEQGEGDGADENVTDGAID